MIRFELLVTEELKDKMSEYVAEHKLINNLSTLLRAAVEEYMENHSND